MSEDTSFQGSEAMTPETPFERIKSRFNYQCERCGHAFHKIGYGAPRRNPACPNVSCAAVAENRDLRQRMSNLERMLEEQKAPGHIGANNTVKAVDYTANAVMEDYKLTDLKDNIREGEAVAPKLPPAQQAQADNYFVGAPAATPGATAGGFRDTKIPDFKTGRPHMVRAKQMEMLGRRAIAGAFRGMSVAPTAIVPEATKGSSPIIRVRVEDNPGFTGQRSGR